MSNSTFLSDNTESILIVVTVALVIWSFLILGTISCGIVHIYFITEDTNRKTRKIKKHVAKYIPLRVVDAHACQTQVV